MSKPSKVDVILMVVVVACLGGLAIETQTIIVRHPTLAYPVFDRPTIKVLGELTEIYERQVAWAEQIAGRTEQWLLVNTPVKMQVRMAQVGGATLG